MREYNPEPEHEEEVTTNPKKGVLVKKILYMLTAVAAAALVMSVATIIRNVNDGREYTTYFEQAVSAYDCGDYNSALACLRKAYNKSKTDECVIFMADCYEAQRNYEKALELLKGLDGSSSSVSSRISAIEQKRNLSSDTDKISVAGKEYPVNTTGIVLDNLGLTDGVINELTRLYALNNLSAAGNGITSIEPIFQLGGLTTLNLSDNSISDIGPLSSLSNLRTLYLNNNPISDLSPLYSLTGLTTLSIKGVEVSEEQLAALSSALPNCAVHSEQASKSVADITIGGVTFKSNVTELNLSGLGIWDISGLSGCVNLSRLDLSGNNISDLSPLMDIPGLTLLNASGNSITDLSPIMGMTSISNLDVRNNSIDSTAPLSMMTGLVELHLENNPLRSISGLSRLRSIETLGLSSVGLKDDELYYLAELSSLRLLYIEENQELTGDAVEWLKSMLPLCSVRHSELVVSVTIGEDKFRPDADYVDVTGRGVTDISDMARFTALRTANLGSNNIGDLTPLTYLTTLQSLDISNNYVGDLTPLAGLALLENLNLAGNSISDITPLMGLTNLKHLNLSGNLITPEQVTALAAAIPNCEIVQ